MIALTCSRCDKKLKVKEELAGKKVRCPGCGQLVQDQDIRREAAVKFLPNQADPRQKARFVEEAQITGQLEHRLEENIGPGWAIWWHPGVGSGASW